MNYTEYTFRVANESLSEILVAELAELGFDSFSDYQGGRIQCYISEPELFARSSEIQSYLTGRDFELRLIEPENWNALWESNFEPIALGDLCYIRAPFHTPAPGGSLHDVVIMPKMSFGTGHHPTTYLMVESILRNDLSGKSCLDMGTGTGILAILGAKCGAAHFDAIDVDDWACENCRENVQINGVSDRVDVFLGDSRLLAVGSASDGSLPGIVSGGYDFILANINRNILLEDMASYVRVLRPGGIIIFSGFLEFDISAIEACAVGLGLRIRRQKLRQGWASVTAFL